MEKIKSGDIGSLIERQDYKHAGLYDAAGKCLVALNSNKVPLAQKVEQIKKRLSGLPEGFYTLRCQHNIGKKYPAFDYIIQIGNLSETPVMLSPTANTQQPITEQVRGWDQALKDKEELATLRAEVQRLKHIENSLQEEEEEEEEEEEDDADAEQSPLAQAGTMAEKILPQVAPFFEKYFEQRDRQLNLQEREMALREAGGGTAGTERKAVTGNFKPRHPWRPVPQVQDPKFVEYCNWLQEQPDENFDNEFAYLEQTHPEQFAVAKKLMVQNEGNN